MRVARAFGRALLVVALSLGAGSARAAENASIAVLDEIAGALGFASSSQDGFWQAYAEAVAAEAAAREEARVAEATMVIDDALQFGRRIEEKPVPTEDGYAIPFIEYVLPADGDFATWGAFMRSGTDWVDVGIFGGETITRVTKYFDGFEPVGQVTSVIEDGIETVVSVVAFKPGAIDLKPGDSRQIPKLEDSKAGKRPASLDPKADGSLGVAGGPQAANQEKPTGGEHPSQPAAQPGDSGTASSNDEPAEETAGTESTEDTGTGATETSQSSDTSTDSHEGWQFNGSATTQREDGTTDTASSYTRPDGVHVWVETTTRPDGTSATTTSCQKGGEAVDCGSGRTDEPTCSGAACAHFETIAGTLVETTLYQKMAAPIDYGDPADPNREPIDADPSQIPSAMDPTHTDPANPGEEEAEIQTIELEMIGTLQNRGDPLDPFRSEAPTLDPPSTNDEDWRP